MRFLLCQLLSENENVDGDETGEGDGNGPVQLQNQRDMPMVALSKLPAAKEPKKWAMAAIIAMFAISDSHWKATFPAMYRLLPATVPMSRLLIIISFPSTKKLVMANF